MATVFDHVRPGDLISAQQFNALLDVLADMSARIQELETGKESTTPRIERFIPAGEQEAGSVVTIVGANFVMPPRDPVKGTLRNIIRIDDVPISQDDYVFTGTGTSASSLMFRLPSALAPSPGASRSRSVIVSIENEQGNVSRTYSIAASTATLPSPTITRVSGPGGGNNPRIGDTVHVIGTNFVSGVTILELTFLDKDGATEIVYPPPSGSPIAVTFISAADISFVVPDVRPFIAVPLEGLEGSVRVTVAGAPESVSADIVILRSS